MATLPPSGAPLTVPPPIGPSMGAPPQGGAAVRSASPSAGPSLASLARLGFGFGLAWVWLAALRLFGLDFGLDFGWSLASA